MKLAVRFPPDVNPDEGKMSAKIVRGLLRVKVPREARRDVPLEE
ncbi:MAG: hypothetical protein ACTSU5_01840 [Promethearchaeota archaeon]